MKLSRKLVLAPLLLCISVIMSGCGETGLKGLYPVKGILTHQGQPLAGVTITLMPVNPTPGARAATAVSGTDGTFSLRTLKPNDGIFPGEYKIALVSLVASRSQEEMRELDAKGAAYNYTSTNIMPQHEQTVTVNKGKNEPLVIDITEDLIVPKYKWYQDELKKKKP